MTQAQAGEFRERVREVVRNIPRGQVLTYGEVAALAGNYKAARGVASIMSGNYDPDIPCHRVVAKNGLGGYNRGGLEVKRQLLREEGVEV